MFKKMLMAVVGLILSLSGFAGADDDFGIKFNGFVKSDHFFDSRQVVSAREGHFLLYPVIDASALIAADEDLGAVPSFNQLAIQTRLTGTITAPDAFGAKVSGVIEGAFFGHSDGDVNGFRLRLAFAKMIWNGKNTLILGQYWHPMFVTAVFPGTISFNTGVPFQPFSRNPQIRLESKLSDSFTIIAAALSQRDFASTGGSTPLRNAVVPNLHLQGQFSASGNVFGAGVDFKMLRPSIDDPVTDMVDDAKNVNGLSFIAYGKIKAGRATIKAEGVLGQNLTDHLMLGGYAVKDRDLSATTPIEYTPTQVLSFWGEISGGTAVQPGIFFGFTQNNGAIDDVFTAINPAGRGTNIQNVLRVSPRIAWNSGKVRLAGEVEYTQATYVVGSDLEDAAYFDAKLKPENGKSVANIRALFAAYLFF